MYSLAQKCMQFKANSSSHGMLGLMIGILGENTEVSNVNQIMVLYILANEL